jgi:hypothetical protein
VKPAPERSRARAVDPVIDLGGVGHAPRLGTARWPTTRPRPAGAPRGCEPSVPEGATKRKWNSPTSSSASSTSGGRGPEAPGHRSRRGTEHRTRTRTNAGHRTTASRSGTCGHPDMRRSGSPWGGVLPLRQGSGNLPAGPALARHCPLSS